MSPLKLWWALLLLGGLGGMMTYAVWSYQQLPEPAGEAAANGPGPSAPKKDSGEERPAKKKKEPPPMVVEPVVERRYLEDGKRFLDEKKLHAALEKFEAAAKALPSDSDVIRLRDSTKSTLADVQGRVDAAREKLASKQFAEAKKLLDAAAARVSDHPAIPGLLAQAERGLTPGSLLAGDVLVLVLYTKTSTLNGTELPRQLSALQADPTYRKKLLDRGLYVLTREGVKKWSSKMKLDEKSAFTNKDFGPLFNAAFQAIDSLTVRASNKGFKSILIWETNIDPTVETEPKLNLPAGRQLRLCYRFTDRNEGAAKPKVLEGWFGERKFERLVSIEDLKGLLEEQIDN
jgi:hypothetical protein